MKKYIYFAVSALFILFLFIRAFIGLNDGYLPVYNKMNVIVDSDYTTDFDISIKANENIWFMPKTKKLINKELRGKVEVLDVLVKKGVKLNEIVIFNNLKVHYFANFDDFDKKDIKLCNSEGCNIYTDYKIPDSVKYNKQASSYNYNSKLNTFCSFIVNIFSLNKAFIVPYIFLLLTVIIGYKLNIKIIPFPPGLATSAIFLIAILLRLNGLFDYPLWNDEYYSLEFASKPFDDPGNPPLFYILLNIWIKLFGSSLPSIKFFPFIIGLLVLFSLFLFLFQKYGIKKANIGLFIAGLNFSLIYFSTECRSYILQAMFTPILIYYLFKIFDENRKKDYLIYAILSAIVINIHYYELLFVFANFLFGSYYLYSKKRYSDLKRFFITNILSFIFFLPYFFHTAFNKALLEKSFNVWIADTDLAQIKKCIFYLFGGGVSFVLSIIFFIRNYKNRMVKYCLFTIAMVIFSGVILSYLIRPMLIERYLVLLLPVFIIFLLSVKKPWVLLFIWFLFIQAGESEKYNNKKGTIELPMSFAMQYYDIKGGNINCILNTFFTSQKSLPNYRNEINYFSNPLGEVDKTVQKILSKENKPVIFTSLINPKTPVPDNYKCYFNSTSDMCVWIITN